ncbi:alpha/beta hydrolase [[Clostridium] dakarense]|uniref:alpha/beta hydrolase n=1 Tax=Faecalimicrobium dakarense TaxID=1301100 RepID=UPI0004AD619F|nr:alpha/beta hydrolase [[Clostridium] dakarense]
MYKDLVKKLGENKKVEIINGQEIIIKNVPDAKEEGNLDPRVMDVMLNPDKYPYENKNADKAYIFNNFSVGMIRSIFGWDNEDLTNGEIETTHKIIKGENGDIPVRIYSPKCDEKMPALVFIHGGGFIAGSVDVVENPCKLIAKKANAVVISVDYRLAPENPFPKGFTDCFDVIKWVYNNGEEINIDSNKIGVAGDSAGGNLSAVCTLKDRDLGTNMIKYQALIYPATIISDKEYPYYNWSIDEYEMKSNEELIKKAICALGDATAMLDLYMTDKSLAEDKYVSPLLVEDLSSLPKTLMVVGEYDFIRVQGEAYSKRLKEANVNCRTIRYRGMDHAFIDKLGLYPQAEDCMNEIANDLKSL